MYVLAIVECTDMQLEFEKIEFNKKYNCKSKLEACKDINLLNSSLCELVKVRV